MTNITYQDVLERQAQVPWPHLHQVEQALLLCRAMVAIFNDKFLSEQVAMRGGTVLHKVHLAPAARYSEDIDLVLVGDRPEAHIEKALNRVLRPCLAKRNLPCGTASLLRFAMPLGLPVSYGLSIR